MKKSNDIVFIETVLCCPENEIWLSFAEDDNAEAFDIWWQQNGEKAFLKWLKEEWPKYFDND